MSRESVVLAALLAGRQAARSNCVPSGPDDVAVVAHQDDVAVVPGVELGTGVLVASTDGLEEGEHFRQGWLSWSDIAYKLLAVNLSDLATAGAEPLAWLLGVSWPEALGADAAESFGRALGEAEIALACPLIAGDTDLTAGPLRLTATALGRAPSRPRGRSQAGDGNALFVSGPLGGAAAVVTLLLAGRTLADTDTWRDAFRCFARPLPRLELGRALVGRATAVMDLSDGLAADAATLGLASGLAVHLDSGSVPVHPAATELGRPELALFGGEDYELLVAGPRHLADLIPGLVHVGTLRAGQAGVVHGLTAARPPQQEASA